MQQQIIRQLDSRARWRFQRFVPGLDAATSSLTSMTHRDIRSNEAIYIQRKFPRFAGNPTASKSLATPSHILLGNNLKFVDNSPQRLRERFWEMGELLLCKHQLHHLSQSAAFDLTQAESHKWLMNFHAVDSSLLVNWGSEGNRSIKERRGKCHTNEYQLNYRAIKSTLESVSFGRIVVFLVRKFNFLSSHNDEMNCCIEGARNNTDGGNNVQKICDQFSPNNKIKEERSAKKGGKLQRDLWIQ